jgi:hypothetical protein
MKRILAVALLAACVLALSPNLAAQCSEADFRGTYCLSCNGWVDLSTLNPNLPKGYVPASHIGVLKLDAAGHGSGWHTSNMGGLALTMDIVNLTYKIKDDCTVESTYSLKIRELGVTMGPVTRILVRTPSPSAYFPGQPTEMRGVNVGAGVGQDVTPCELKLMSPSY